MSNGNGSTSQKATDQKEAAANKNEDFNLLNDTLLTHNEAAKKKLTADLRHKNQNETTFNFAMQGDPNWCAGIVIALDSTFGVYKGNYLLDKCIHRIGRQGYTTEIEGHKCLKGHDAGSAPAKPPTKAYSPGASVPPQNLPPPSNVAIASRL